MDRHAVAPAPLALRAIFEWVPLPLATWYWKRSFASPRAEYYFALHARHAAKEMAALAADVRLHAEDQAAPNLYRLLGAIDGAAARSAPR